MKILSRRNALYSALIFAAASTALTTAITTTAIATGATVTIPAAAAVSPRMSELVASYKAALTTVDTIAPNADTDPVVWVAAEEAFMSAQAALMAEKPRNFADFSAKFDSLVEIDASEGEFAVLQRLSDDARALAGGQ